MKILVSLFITRTKIKEFVEMYLRTVLKDPGHYNDDTEEGGSGVPS